MARTDVMQAAVDSYNGNQALREASTRLESIICDIAVATIPLRPRPGYDAMAAYDEALRKREPEIRAVISSIRDMAGGARTSYADDIERWLDQAIAQWI